MHPTRNLACAIVALAAAGSAFGDTAPSWSPGELVLAGGGCPFESPDARSLFFASGRPGGSGGIDIWVLDRTEVEGPWSDPKNLIAPVNSDADDFCPTPRGRTLYFISTRAHAEACGGGDIYVTRQSPAGDWQDPVHLPCAPEGPNTAGTERSPVPIGTWYGTFLFYSSNGGVDGADDDIYVSVQYSDGAFGRGHVVHALSTPDYDDQMPTVRARSHGFEIVFNSNRPSWGWRNRKPAFGEHDVYYAQAHWLPFLWSEPSNAGPNVNTGVSETRASLSQDGQRLYVGRGDIYVSERR